MKHKFSSVKLLLFLVLLIITTTAQTSARKLSDKLQGEEADTLNITNKISSEKSVAEIDQTTEDSFSKLMGVEECEEDHEECLGRRVLGEVHLDYIYTQKHKP